MRGKAGIERLLREIMETGGLTDAMEEKIKALQSEFDEREGMLRRYGEIRESDDGESAEFEEIREDSAVDNTDEERSEHVETEEPINWEARYNELQTKYLNRFFNSGSEERRDYDSTLEKKDSIVLEQDSDVERDGTVQSFDDLLYRAEDDNNGGLKED